MRRLFPILALLPAALGAQATRQAYLDNTGVVRWRDNRQEVALFGANYVLPTASDYRAAGYVKGDRKRMIDEDMAQFARMGWDGMRLTFWGDWEASDSAGNLIQNDHLDLQDYLIAKARERGVYMLFSPIQLYSANWPDAMEKDPSTPGFGRVFGKGRMGTDPAAIASQVNYLKQILNHVNPYTGVALKDEPAILFVELVNEPWHHPEDLAGSIRYINALTDAVRSTGCSKPIFYNVSQDFRIGEAITKSKAQGVTFGWYPTGLNSGRELRGNYLRATDEFPDMLRPELARLPRIVYEFDSPDLRNATMYPAMTRTFRSVGAQMALMFAYDMQGTASRNLGWQTHYLSLGYTPKKAMSTVIAAEMMRRLPRMKSYGGYPENTRFGDFRISAEEDLSELVTREVYLHAGTTTTPAPDAAALTRVAGVGSSPLVQYGGEGAWFLDRIQAGHWRLEVYPDAVPVRDPFEMQSPGKVVTRAISRAWPMTIRLPDLGNAFSMQPLGGTAGTIRSSDGRVTVTPGVYILSASGAAPTLFPARIGALGMAEYHPPPPDTLPLMVQSLSPPEVLSTAEGKLTVRVVDPLAPDSVLAFVRPNAGGWFQRLWMRPVSGYRYEAAIPPGTLREGPNEFVVTVYRGGTWQTFPGGVRQRPWDWDWYSRDTWPLDVVGVAAPLQLFSPRTDAARLTFTRIGDAGRRGLFRLGISEVTGQPLFHLELPVDSSGWSPPDYTASLVIVDRIRARGAAIGAAGAVRMRVRGLGAKQTLHVTLMEDDGTSWSAAVPLDNGWSEKEVPLSAFTVGRGVMLPQGFPGEWSYWVGPATGRGGALDKLRPEHIERIQISLRGEEGVRPTPGGYGVEIEAVALTFAPR